MLRISLKWLFVLVGLACVAAFFLGPSLVNNIARQRTYVYVRSLDHAELRRVGSEFLEKIQGMDLPSNVCVDRERWPPGIVETEPTEVWILNADFAVLTVNYGPNGKVRLVIAPKGKQPWFGRPLVDGMTLD